MHPPAMPAHPLPGPGAITARLLDGFEVWVGADPLAELPPGKGAHAAEAAAAATAPAALARAAHRALLARCRCGGGAQQPQRDDAPAAPRARPRRLGAPQRRRLPAAAGGRVWLDTEQFVQHAEAGRAEESCGRADAAISRYEAAQALYRSDLLEGDENEPALAAEAQALRDCFSQVLERLAGLREQAADWHGCLRATPPRPGRLQRSRASAPDALLREAGPGRDWPNASTAAASARCTSSSGSARATRPPRCTGASRRGWRREGGPEAKPVST
ncbi:MAG: bacterial transcriptional activator domain-containing protein [Rubrivivax sp.]